MSAINSFDPYEIDPSDIEEMKDSALGLKVKITLSTGTFVGVINNTDNPHRLTLEQVSNALSGQKRVGTISFSYESIKKINVIGEDEKARKRLLKDVYKEEKSGRKLLMKKVVPPHLQHIDEDRNSVENAVKTPSSNNIMPAPLPPFGISRPTEFLIVESLDESFHVAVGLIMKETAIGVACEGVNIGRSGTLAWLAVSVSTHVFLFDIAKIGVKEVLESRIKSILESTDIIKIVHDCRPLEDYFYHQYKINMHNVFDSQAAEIYIHMCDHKNSAPSFVTGLPSLLKKYLKMPDEHIYYKHLREEFIEDDESIWLERPLSEHLCQGLVKQVCYLPELRESLIKRMLVDLYQVTALHLGAYRDKDTASLAKIESQVVPEEIQRLKPRSDINHIEPHNVRYTRDMLVTAADGHKKKKRFRSHPKDFVRTLRGPHLEIAARIL